MLFSIFGDMVRKEISDGEVEVKGSDQHYENLKRIYEAAAINSEHYPSARIQLSHGSCQIDLTLESSYHQALGSVHGSVYFKLLDDAAYFAAQSVTRDFFLYTTHFQLHMMRPAVQGVLRAEGSLRMKSKHLWIADAVLLDQKGRELAYGSGHFTKSEKTIKL